MTHTDPVCGMTIDEEDAIGTVQHQGVTYYFCNPSCLEQFESDPARFLGVDAAGRAAEAPPGATFTCPMHPEIVRDGPGACPICGMALEPRTLSLTDAPNPELADMTRRLWIAAVLGLPVFIVAMLDMAVGGRMTRTEGPWINLMGLALSTPVVFWAGWPFFERAWASIVNRMSEHVHAHRNGCRVRVPL